MRNFLFLLFFLLNFIKISAQLDVKISEEICVSLKSITESDSTKLFAEQAALQTELLSKAIKNLPEETIKKEKNFLNFLNVFNYKIARNLRKNCDLKISFEPNRFLQLTSVVDFNDAFTSEQFKNLRNQVRKLRTDKSIDILILEVDNFYPFDDITDYSFNILENWQSGIPSKKGKMIIVFSKDLRQIRISTDYISKQFIDDRFLQNIIDNQIYTNFKVENFYKGISATLTEIEKKL